MSALPHWMQSRPQVDCRKCCKAITLTESQLMHAKCHMKLAGVRQELEHPVEAQFTVRANVKGFIVDHGDYQRVEYEHDDCQPVPRVLRSNAAPRPIFPERYDRTSRLRHPVLDLTPQAVDAEALHRPCQIPGRYTGPRRFLVTPVEWVAAQVRELGTKGELADWWERIEPVMAKQEREGRITAGQLRAAGQIVNRLMEQR